MRKIQEIKQWRLDHSKARQEQFNSQRKEQIKQEIKQVQDIEKKHQKKDLDNERKRNTIQQQIKLAMTEQQMFKVEAKAVQEAQKISEKQLAIDLEK